jgi:hypothetical protein
MMAYFPRLDMMARPNGNMVVYLETAQTVPLQLARAGIYLSVIHMYQFVLLFLPLLALECI